MGLAGARPHPKCGRGCTQSPLLKILRNHHCSESLKFRNNLRIVKGSSLIKTWNFRAYAVGNFFHFPALEYNSIEVPVVARKRNKARNRRHISNEQIELNKSLNE